MGLGTALLAALLPALEVAARAPQLGLARSVVERRARRLARRGWRARVRSWRRRRPHRVAFSGRSLSGGLLALFLLLLGSGGADACGA